MRILLAAHPAVGHTNALLAVGRRLRQDGARVRFAIPALPETRLPVPEIVKTAARLPGAIEDAGIDVIRLRPLLRTIPYTLALPWMSGARELRTAAAIFSIGASVHARALERAIAADRPDAVVADYLFFPAWLAAERHDLRFVALYHSAIPFPVPGRASFAAEALVRALDERLARERRTMGLPPAQPGLLARPYARDLNLLATAPALEGHAEDFGPRTRWVGPCVDGRVEADATFPFARLRPDACKVYVSLGTVYNAHPERFRALLRGLAAPGVQIVVSAGASFDALASLASDDLLLFHRVPQLAVLRAVDFVVTHGGNNTVNEALTAGRAMLVLPIGGEQEVNARRVDAIGAGIALRRADLSAEGVRSAFARLRGTPSFRERAASIAGAVSGMNGAENAARLIGRVARAEALDG